ncbi:hypothetical protein HK098_000509 [Nowakowskiella sp. JEL0407]|nr:hypothetical protein HK098_000509 [Nowakowskiella sp. JEL0407]
MSESNEDLSFNADTDEEFDEKTTTTELSSPTIFLKTILSKFTAAFSNLPSSYQNLPELSGIKDAYHAARTGLDFLDILQDIDPPPTDPILDEIAVSPPFEFYPTTPTSSPLVTPPPLPLRKYSPTIPPEIISRILSFVCGDSECIVPFSNRTVLKTLYSCTLINKHWNLHTSSVLWKRIDLDPGVQFGKFILCLTAAKTRPLKGNFTKSITISGTDTDIALLSLASRNLPNLQSLEFRRVLSTSTEDSTSLKSIFKLSHKFNLKSLQVYSIPAVCFEDLLHFLKSCKDLINLDISFRVEEYNTFSIYWDSEEYNFSEIFGASSELKAVSFWMIPLFDDSVVLTLSNSCKYLKAVRIDDCARITMNSFLTVWNNCRHIEIVMFRRIKYEISDSILLETRESMKTIIFDSCWYSDALIGEIGKSAPNLSTLYIESVTVPNASESLTECGIRLLSKHQRRLKYISFVGFSFPAKCIVELLAVNPNVVGLNLAKLGHKVFLTDAQLLEMSVHFKKLEALELYMQSRLTEDAIKAALVNCKMLKSLGLNNIPITDNLLHAIPQLCPNLERIDIGMDEDLDESAGSTAGEGCTAKGFQFLIDSCPRVHTISPAGIDTSTVQWKHVFVDEPVGQAGFSEFTVWRSEVRNVVRGSGVFLV